MAAGTRDRYTRLLAYLEQLPAAQEAVRLSWAALTRLRGAPLPASATSPGYWAGDLAYSNWGRLGFRASLDRNRWTVTFSRRGTGSAGAAGTRTAGKYAPLLRYLAALPPERTSVTLTFGELEALIGPLSATARTVAHFWTASAVARGNWQRLGFRARLDRSNRAVDFTRSA